MAAKKKHHRKPSPLPPEQRASIPAIRLPQPDLTLWMLAGITGLIFSGLLRESAKWLVMRPAGIPGAALALDGARFDRMTGFWTALNAGDTAGAGSIANPVAVGSALAAGLAVSVASTWLASAGANHIRWRPWLAGLIFGTLFRMLKPASAVLMTVAAYVQGDTYRPQALDEHGVELIFGVPAAFLLLLEFVLITPPAATIWQKCDLTRERLRGLALAAGICFGLGLILVAS